MAKKKNAPATAGATSNEEVVNPVVETLVVEETPVVEDIPAVEETPAVAETPVVEETPEKAENLEEVEVIPSNIFVAEDGTEVEFAVKHFIHAKRKYTVEEAVVEIPEALQELYDRKSFIFKKV